MQNTFRLLLLIQSCLFFDELKVSVISLFQLRPVHCEKIHSQSAPNPLKLENSCRLDSVLRLLFISAVKGDGFRLNRVNICSRANNSSVLLN